MGVEFKSGSGVRSLISDVVSAVSVGLFVVVFQTVRLLELALNRLRTRRRVTEHLHSRVQTVPSHSLRKRKLAKILIFSQKYYQKALCMFENIDFTLLNIRLFYYKYYYFNYKTSYFISFIFSYSSANLSALRVCQKGKYTNKSTLTNLLT